jgi:hypothetical protein
MVGKLTHPAEAVSPMQTNSCRIRVIATECTACHFTTMGWSAYKGRTGTVIWVDRRKARCQLVASAGLNREKTVSKLGPWMLRGCNCRWGMGCLALYIRVHPSNNWQGTGNETLWGKERKKHLAVCAAKCLIQFGFLAPRPGLEPGTYGLTVRRSTD